MSAVSPKAIGFFEKLATARNATVPKNTQQHTQDARVPPKYVDRAVEFLAQVGLLKAERRDGLIKLVFPRPVTSPPPVLTPDQLPPWAREETPPPPDPARFHHLDAGICAWCSCAVALEEAHVDHIWPLDEQGADADDNLALQCPACADRWIHTPDHPDFGRPVRFRGRAVMSVDFDRSGGAYVPRFTLE